MEILVETYKFEKNALNVAKKLISNTLPDAERGNGVLREALCSLVNIKTNKGLKPENYWVHHMDGNHHNNTITNFALIRLGGGYSHTGIHNYAIEASFFEFFHTTYKLPTDSTITIDMLKSLTPLEIQVISTMYCDNLIKGINRKSNAYYRNDKDKNGRTHSKDDIILIKDFI